jgi:hypothetical protein
MNGDKKLYLYSGLAIALAVVAYVVITKKKPLQTSTNENQPNVEEEKEEVVVTPTGDEILEEQNIIEPTLKEILKKPLAQIKLSLLNKKLYTKLDDVNPRTTPYVNNGWFVNNNIGGKIKTKGTFAGNVVDVANDKGLLKNTEGKVYVWFKINPSASARKQIEDDSNIFTAQRFNTFWLREDVVSLKK